MNRSEEIMKAAIKMWQNDDDAKVGDMLHAVVKFTHVLYSELAQDLKASGKEMPKLDVTHNGSRFRLEPVDE